MSKSLPRYLIGIDTETSGANIPEQASPNGAPSQCLSIALIVLDTHNQALPEVASFYKEIRFNNNQFDWSEQAEKIHGLTREYLASAPTMAQVADDVLAFIRRFISSDQRAVLLGHNPSFDRAFLMQVFQAGGHQLKLHHRMVDGFTLGFGYYGLNNSDEQFALLGQSRGYHHPIEDIRQTAEMLRVVRRGGNKELIANGLPPAGLPDYARNFVQKYLKQSEDCRQIALYFKDDTESICWLQNEGMGNIYPVPLAKQEEVVVRKMIADGIFYPASKRLPTDVPGESLVQLKANF